MRGLVKFRIGRIVFASLSPEGTVLGFGFSREERAALIASEPEKFFWPARSGMRCQWVRVRLAAVDAGELRGLVVSA